MADVTDTNIDMPANLREHKEILDEAFNTYMNRNYKYNDAWKQSGWRGALFDLRKKVERAWVHLFNAEVLEDQDKDFVEEPDVDDLIDSINYAVFAIRGIREGNRDGKGGWW